MINLTDEELERLVDASSDWEKINAILKEIDVVELIELLDALNKLIELLELNQYARLKRDDE